MRVHAHQPLSPSSVALSGPIQCRALDATRVVEQDKIVVRPAHVGHDTATSIRATPISHDHERTVRVPHHGAKKRGQERFFIQAWYDDQDVAVTSSVRHRNCLQWRP